MLFIVSHLYNYIFTLYEYIWEVFRKRDLTHAIMVFNGKVAGCEQLSVDVLATSQHQHKLSSAIEKAGFLSLLDGASTVDKARLLAISAPQAHAWLRAQPSPKLGLDLLPNEVQALVKWWLGLPVFTDADACPHCSQTLDIHGHHALICHAGSDVVTRHNRLHDSFADICRRACLAPELERGVGSPQQRAEQVRLMCWCQTGLSHVQQHLT